MLIPHSSFIVIYTSNIQKTAEFYKAIGCEIKLQETDKVVVWFESVEFHFILETSEPFEAYRYIAKNTNRGQGIIFYVGTASIETVYAKVIEAGGSLKTDIFINHWSAREFLFEDPNGYKFAVYQDLS